MKTLMKFQATTEANLYADLLLAGLVGLFALLAHELGRSSVPTILWLALLLGPALVSGIATYRWAHYQLRLIRLRKSRGETKRLARYATAEEDLALSARLPSVDRHARGDSAVSPVIGVILMVAITVILAAGVYVWVTGFTNTQHPPANLALMQQGDASLTNATAATSCTAGATWCAKWIVNSASSGFPPTKLRVTDATTNTGDATCLVNGAAATNTPLAAGDLLACYTTTLPRVASGDTMTFSDREAGSVIAQLTLR